MKNLTVKSIDGNVEIGRVGGTGAISKFTNLNFRIDNTSSRSVNVERANLKGSQFAASGDGIESLVFGAQGRATRVSASLGEEDDYLEFKTGSSSKAGSYNMGDDDDSVVFNAISRDDVFNLGDGGDTITFGSGSKVKDVIVDLGDNDSDIDRVIIDEDAKVSGQIDNFGDFDSLVIGATTYNADQIRAIYNSDGKIRTAGGVLRVNLENP